MVVDPIADMLTRIRNAQAVQKETVSVPFSQIKYQIAKVLEKEKFIAGIEVRGRKTRRTIELTLNSDALAGLKRISKPGQRAYISVGNINRSHKTQILSTSAGIMTAQAARRKNVGGELLCEVW
jgi:small subunit ribosomal protein S8